jgi:arabinan endo-1,5-alpha-L-arabinosidase
MRRPTLTTHPVLFALLSTVALAQGEAPAPNPPPQPDIVAAADLRIHDPVMIRENGTFYLFGTGRGISVWSSTDRITWHRQPQVLDPIPAWTQSVVPGFKGHTWAPDIVKRGDTYYLYYSISAGGKITSAIGVATNRALDPKSPAYKWVDHGMVVQSIPYRDLWNAIDPQLVFEANGTPWLAFGSFWAGLRAVKLDATLLKVAEPQQWRSLAKRERSVLVDDAEPEPASIEAPFVFSKNGWHYLFVSWDHCCRGEKSDYKVVVGRSKELMGPYVDRDGKPMTQGGGTPVVSGNARWPGIGHNSAYTFDGRDYFVAHAYDAKDGGRSKLKILDLGWDEHGWPKVDASALSDPTN